MLIYRRYRGVALALIAIIGGACGFAVTGRRATACDCLFPTWQVSLQSATSSDPSIDHRPLWPAEATLWQGTEETSIEIVANDGSTGSLRFVRARP